MQIASRLIELGGFLIGRLLGVRRLVTAFGRNNESANKLAHSREAYLVSQ